MIAEALIFLRDQAQKALTPQVVFEDEASKHVYVNGSVVDIEKPRYRRVKLSKLHDLVEWIDSYGNEGQSAVYIGRNAVYAFVSQQNRLEYAFVPLVFTTSFDSIVEADDQSLDQRALLKLLKVRLDGCVSPEIIEAYRKIDVSSTSRKVSEMKATGDRGMSEFAIATAQQTPELFVVKTNVYVDGGPLQVPQALRVSVDIDFSISPIRFGLSVLGDGIEDAVSEAAMSIKEFIVKQLKDQDSSVQVYFGEANLS